MIERLFVEFSARKLQQLHVRIADCLERLNEEQIWIRQSDKENAVGNLVLHLAGNVRQWIGTGVAGKPDVRARDREFAARGGVSRQDLLERLDAVVKDALAVIESLPPERLKETTSVQGYNVTVLEAVYHVVEHFAQHTGQIIFVTKLLTQDDLQYYRHLSAKSGHGAQTP